MDLGAFSLSLAVRNLERSRDFYEKLGFAAVGGAAPEGWLILRNGDCTLGLFQGMFPRNMLTFNPGWDSSGAETGAFTDIRTLQARLMSAGVTFESEADPDGSGPASFMITDPDGNPVLVDQHR